MLGASSTSGGAKMLGASPLQVESRYWAPISLQVDPIFQVARVLALLHMEPIESAGCLSTLHRESSESAGNFTARPDSIRVYWDG